MRRNPTILSFEVSMKPTIRITKFNSNFLNGIRFVAIWSVLLGHLFSYYQVTILKDQQFFPYIQNIGVVLLFILSGFLTAFSIHRKLSLDSSYNYKTFLIERTSRIYSAYLPALIFVFLVDSLNLFLNKLEYTYLSSFNPLVFIGNILMLQDFPFLSRWVTSFGSGRPFWTLAIEWWAYIVFGYGVLVIYRDWKKANIKWYSILILGILSFEPILKMVGGRGNGLMLTWLLGVAIYLLYDKLLLNRKQTMFIQTLTFVSFISTFLIALWVKDAYNTTFVFSLSFSILFFLIWGNTKDNNTEFKLLSLLSCYMYSLYLVHYPIVDLIYRSDIALNSTLRILISVILSNFFAILFYLVFERNSKQLAKTFQKMSDAFMSRFSQTKRKEL